jgi:hypothetical protein
LLFIILTAVSTAKWSTQSIILVVGLDLLAVLLILALYSQKRFHWAGRAATSLVFLAFLAYLIDEIASGHSWHFGPRSEPSPLNALLGLVTIGLPCLRYTLLGRFGGKVETTSRTTNPWVTGPCSQCPKPLAEHDWAMFASTVASEKNMTRLTEFFEKIRTHDWHGVATFTEFDATENDVVAYAVRCESGGFVAVVRSPFELYENDELYLRENVSATEMPVIESLIPATSWHAGEPSKTTANGEPRLDEQQ